MTCKALALQVFVLVKAYAKLVAICINIWYNKVSEYLHGQAFINRKDIILVSLNDFKNEYIGLNETRVNENIKLYGYNSETKFTEKEKGFSVLRAVFSLKFLLLAASSVLSFLYGEIVAGIILAVLTVAYVIVETVKGKKCDEEYFRIRQKSKVFCNVVRDGKICQVHREYLVPDDIIILEDGENVPADAHLLEIYDLTVDESVFTGSRTPVQKITGADSLSEELKRSCIYKGTKITSGRLAARITATGVDTKLFKTYGNAEETDVYFTSAEKTVRRVSRVLNIAAAVILAFSALFRFTAIDVNAENPLLNTIYNTFYPAIAFALCFIPAEIETTIRLYYIKGVKRLGERSAQVKNLTAIEHMSAVTCICIDKTSDIAKGQLELADELAANAQMMTNISVLSCEKKHTADHIDQAIILNATFKGTNVAELQENELLQEYPFDNAVGISGNLWSVNGSKLLCVKGSPDVMLPLCDVPADLLYTVQNKQIAYEKQGYITLVVAFAQLSEEDEAPKSLRNMRYKFIGLTAFDTPTKDNIPYAIRSCNKAGIKVVMTTGDSPETALSIARKIGIKNDGIVTGEQLASGEKIDLSGVGIFAKVTPSQKMDIIKRLQDSGEIVVAFGGENIDSNILEQADIGITTAESSGAASEACEVTTASGDFEHVVDILKVARQVYGNVKRCISLNITALATLAAFACLNLLLDTPQVITPVICGIIGILIVPAVSLMFLDNSSDLRADISSSRFIGKGKIRKSFFIRPFIQALGLILAEIVFYLISSGYGVNSEETVLQLTPQSASNFLLIFVFGIIIAGWVNLSEKSIADAFRAGQSFAGLISGLTVLFALILVFVPVVNTVLGLETVNVMMPVLALIITIVSQLPSEIAKHTRK